MGWFFLIGFLSFCGQLSQWSLFSYAGEKLTRRLRVATYRATLRCEIAYFDSANNTTGRITSRMAEQAALIKATTGERLVLGAQNIAALAAGCAIAFSASWQIGAAAAACLLACLSPRRASPAAPRARAHFRPRPLSRPTTPLQRCSCWPFSPSSPPWAWCR
jgi:ABC-type multidrug transport system fused ATPase/permease subunit